MSNQKETKLSDEHGNALIYRRTQTDRVSATELAQVTEMMEYARLADMTVVGAVLSPNPDAGSLIIQGIVDDWERDKIDAVVTWDEVMGQPKVWKDKLPGSWIRAAGES